ncbi:MAG: 50S ribosomal protein L25 [Anaerolineae bacterium]|nr:50S ribosomal protein L25 [Anaerolineae bacterium]MCX8067333.1 50S ribosomal protein L25 [Anaerolineae bacterium]MDW7992150.1 50S ribosomal protein L25 [Anaerolineae bacterium]
MQTELSLNAEIRTVVGKKTKQLRARGWIPAVLYGPGVENRLLQIPASEAETVIARAGTSHLITVNIRGDKGPVQVLLKGFQRDPIRRNLLHVDLYQVAMDKPITVEVPIVLVGSSPVLDRKEGILLQGKQTLEIECLPKDLIEAVEVDLSLLTEVDQQITVADLALPPTIRVLDDPDEVIVRVSPLEEEEEIVEEVPTTVEPELIRKRKEEVEEEE